MAVSSYAMQSMLASPMTCISSRSRVNHFGTTAIYTPSLRRHASLRVRSMSQVIIGSGNNFLIILLYYYVYISGGCLMLEYHLVCFLGCLGITIYITIWIIWFILAGRAERAAKWVYNPNFTTNIPTTAIPYSFTKGEPCDNNYSTVNDPNYLQEKKKKPTHIWFIKNGKYWFVTF